MPFIVINTSNHFDPANQVEHATEEAADQAARELLAAQPTAVVRTAKVLQRYSSTVTVAAEAADSEGGA
ncbi:hypothetical protein LOY37_13920 [Pseudomonas sp. B21-012]|uniref:hypothetical protein n=1 Tax=Pseudomonas sp. B21-012 TaxID=2895472 RepID=UPI00215F302A|nr:hypothetical protein [Pseudomonas sp. B21-012]UVM53477.1 hypothetical protein LOY37_13920 [Pseudomonas sp. B21-012]